MSNSLTGIDPTRLSHARIITGGDPGARLSMAKAWAAAVFCRNRRVDGTACQGCAPCRKVFSDLHPDVVFLRPDGMAIKVEAVREMRRGLYLMPNESETRVVVIEDADTLNVSAQNALLNVLEEGVSVFFLLCDAPEALLPTVRSRCALMRLPGRESAPEERADVLQMLTAVARQDDWQVLRQCYALGKLKRDEFTLFLDALSQALFQKLKENVTASGAGGQAFPLPPTALGRIIDQCGLMRARLAQNVAVTHMTGHLAVLLTSKSLVDAQGVQ